MYIKIVLKKNSLKKLVVGIWGWAPLVDGPTTVEQSNYVTDENPYKIK